MFTDLTYVRCRTFIWRRRGAELELELSWSLRWNWAGAWSGIELELDLKLELCLVHSDPLESFLQSDSPLDLLTVALNAETPRLCRSSAKKSAILSPYRASDAEEVVSNWTWYDLSQFRYGMAYLFPSSRTAAFGPQPQKLLKIIHCGETKLISRL